MIYLSDKGMTAVMKKSSKTPKFLTCSSLNYTNANVTVQVGEAVQEGLRDANKSSRVS